MAGTVWTISNLIVAVTCWILIFVLFKYGTRKVHYIWAFFNFIISIWGLGAFLVGLSRDSSTAMIFWKIALGGGLLAPIVFYHVIVVLGELKRKILLRIFYIYTTIAYFLTLFDFVGIKIIYIYDSLYYIKAMDFRWKLVLIIWISTIIYAIFELSRLLIKSYGHRRLQFQYLPSAIQI